MRVPLFFLLLLLCTHNTPRLKVGHCSVWRHQVFTRCMADAKGSSASSRQQKGNASHLRHFIFFFISAASPFFFFFFFLRLYFLGILLLLLHPKDHLLFLLFSLIFLSFICFLCHIKEGNFTGEDDRFSLLLLLFQKDWFLFGDLKKISYEHERNPLSCFGLKIAIYFRALLFLF